MIIKKYIVNDMKEALVRAKYELGAEAVIISQRQIKTGKWYEFFKSKELEVTVAIEEHKTLRENNVEEINKIVTTTINPELESLELDPFFNESSDLIKEQLISYCNLHGKDNYHLNHEEKKDFAKIVLKHSSFEKKLKLCKINVLIGPTGVGKTTTIAKIAARESLINKKKVGLITIDTYRIGAVEQLRTYANILGIPFEVVNQPAEMLEKVRLLSNCDIILIDTLGTSPKDLEKLGEIKRHLKTIERELNTYLVMSLSTDKDTILSILEKYKFLQYDALIITKIDEVSNISNLWYFLENNCGPIQFFCHGQDVPDDITVATLDNIFDYCEENFQYDGSSK